MIHCTPAGLIVQLSHAIQNTHQRYTGFQVGCQEKSVHAHLIFLLFFFWTTDLKMVGLFFSCLADYMLISSFLSSWPLYLVQPRPTAGIWHLYLVACESGMCWSGANDSSKESEKKCWSTSTVFLPFPSFLLLPSFSLSSLLVSWNCSDSQQTSHLKLVCSRANGYSSNCAHWIHPPSLPLPYSWSLCCQVEVQARPEALRLHQCQFHSSKCCLRILGSQATFLFWTVDSIPFGTWTVPDEWSYCHSAVM